MGLYKTNKEREGLARSSVTITLSQLPVLVKAIDKILRNAGEEQVEDINESNGFKTQVVRKGADKFTFRKAWNPFYAKDWVEKMRQRGQPIDVVNEWR